MSKYIKYGLVAFALVLTLSCCINTSVASNATKHYEEGLELYKKGWYDQAIREFDKALDLKRGYVSAHYALGNSYYCKHLYDKAVKQYHKALRYDPDHVKAHYALWLSYRALGMTGDADKELDIYKQLTGKKGKEGKSTSYASNHSEKGGHTKSEDRTTSWHVSDTKSHAPAKTRSTRPSHTETKETKRHETHRTPKEQPKEVAKKHAEISSHSEKPAHSEHKQKESTHTASDSHKPQTHAKATEHGHDAHTPPTHAKAAEHAQASHTPPAHAKAAEHGDSHTPPAHVKAAEHGDSHTPTHVKAAEHGDSHTPPTQVKAAEHGHAAPAHQPAQEGTPKIEVHVSDHTGGAPVKAERPHFVVEKPRWDLEGSGIKAKVKHVWNHYPMGKVIVSTVLYILAAQVWIGVVAMLGLFYWKKR
jgi:Tfp pilus assembly protein PilF